MNADEGADTTLPFQGLTVVELSGTVAGAYCGRLLAGMGASVITVEPLAGGPVRRLGPFRAGAEGLETGAVHLHLNAFKQSVALDVEQEAGRAVLERLAATSDVVVQSVVRASEARVDYEWLQAIRPAAVLVTISGFGSRGPYSDYHGTEGVAMAVGGLTNLTGDPGDTPLHPAGNTGNYAAGGYAAVALAAALFQRRFSDTGQHVEVSVAGAVASIIEVTSQRLVIEGRPVQRTGNWQGPARGIFPCRDGHVGSVMRGREKFHDMADWLGVEDLKDDRFEPFVRNQELGEGMEEELNGLLTAGFLGHDKNDIYHAMQALRMPFGYVADFAEVLSCPQLNEREFFADVDHPKAGRHSLPKGPFVAEGIPWQLGPAPLLGEHTEEVLCGLLGFTGAEFSDLREAGVVVSTQAGADGS